METAPQPYNDEAIGFKDWLALASNCCKVPRRWQPRCLVIGENSPLTPGNIYWPIFRVSQTMCRTIGGLALCSRWHVGCSNSRPKQAGSVELLKLDEKEKKW